MRSLPWIIAAGLSIVGCPGSPSSGLAITISFADRSLAQCVIVGVREAEGESWLETGPMPREGRSALLAGVRRIPEGPRRVVPFVRGYVTVDCTGPIDEVVHSEATIDLDAAGLQSIALTLEGPPDEPDAGTGGGSGGGASGGGGGATLGGGGGSATGGGGATNEPPTVTSGTPLNLAINVSTAAQPTVSFSEAMDGATINSVTFTVTQGANSVAGSVTYSAATNTARFAPGLPLGSNLRYTARISIGATDAAGLALVTEHTWTFTTVPIELGTVRAYAVLGSSVSNTGPTTLDGALGVSPGVTIAGFPPGTATGAPHLGDADAAQARADLQVAWDDAVARTPAAPLTGDLALQTLNAGVYHAAAALSLSTALTLDAQGNPDALFIIQVDGAFDTAAASTVTLINGAKASHVYWQVTGAVTLGAMSSFKGTIFGFAAITVGAGASLEGRALTLNGMVTLSNNAILRPPP